MIEGRNLQDVASAVMAERERAEDYLSPANRLRLYANDGATRLMSHDGGDMPTVIPTNRFHGQLANHLNIPKKYYDRMRCDTPELLCDNVNTWLMADEGPSSNRRLLRTFKPLKDGDPSEGRAFLSDRYRRLDNYDLMEKLMPIAVESGLNVRSAELTENRLYLQMVTPRITGEVKSGDALQAGIVVSNSEVGAGALSIRRLIYRLVCSNGMISARDDGNFRRAHLGGTIEDNGQTSIFTDETLKATDEAFWLQARDAMKAALDSELFEEELDGFRELAGVEVKDPTRTLENVTKRFTLTEDEHAGIFYHLLNGGDLNQWGVVNAITREAEDCESYDRAIELETFGGQYAKNPELN